MALATPVPALTPGMRLGAFEIEALIGAGGMGEVYRARDTRLDRTVAIKVLPAQVAARSGAARSDSSARRAPSRRYASPHLHASRRRPPGRHRLPGHGVPRGRDAGGQACGAVPLPVAQALSVRHRNRRRARQGASRRHRPSRSQAGQHHADQGRRRSCWTSVSPSFGRGSIVMSGTSETRARRSADGARHDPRHAPIHGAGAARREGGRSARPTSSRSARSSTRC